MVGLKITGWTILLTLAMTLLSTTNQADEVQNITKRVPAEWEAQEAIWMQWPGYWEKESEIAFAKIADIVSRYEKLHILYHSDQVYADARQVMSNIGADPQHTNIHWHPVPYDNSWMRDNGPVYVFHDNEIRIQNWEFDAWGGAFGSDIPFDLDNSVPDNVGEILDIPVDQVAVVHERGNLEFNGSDTVILNWSTIGDPNRNLNYSKKQAERDLKKYFGVQQVIFIEGIPEGDLTKGHIDGIARFIDPRTVVVVQCTSRSLCRPDSKDAKIYDRAAEIIEKAGFNVVREPIEGFVSHQGQMFDTNYMNWLVGNGFVIVPGFGNLRTDVAAKSRIESYFPDRDVYLIEMLNSWSSGGGVHCHTNDQPAFPIPKPISN
ncbi:agmatine deiminase family protein [Porticoccaceae bacterium]|nr:agmatine deiminase family protein [Porticoccaceae bacterium]MDA8682845.1 agmatine deiminase family protein [Porticoccaceae bacterium]MDB2344411.1 agmatine deiminase family protein [Porticoccaceae bacterium]